MKAMVAAGALALAVLTGTAAGAKDTGKVVLGTAPNLQTAPIVVAIELGLFDKAGLKVETVKFVAGRRALEAMLGGQLDLAFMAEFPPVIGAMQDQKFGVITAMSKYVANRVIGRADLGFSKVADLAGKKVGTTRGSNSDFFTELLLEKAGIKAEIVNVAPADIVPALVRGDIQAGVTFPDFYPKAKEVLGDKYREYVSRDYEAHFVVAASKAMLDTRPGDLKKFLTALIEADEIIRTNPAAAKAAVVKASEGTLDAAAVDTFWPEFVYRVGLDTDLLDTMAAEARWIDAKGIVKPATADKAKLRSYLADGPLSAIDPARVSLPKVSLSK